MRFLFNPSTFRPMLEGDNGGGGGGDGDPPKADPPKTGDDKPFAIFPDAASFTARLDREANSKLAERAKALGFESVDAMEAVLKDAKSRSDAEKTELQKAQEALAKLEGDTKTVLTTANQRIVKAEAKLQAQALGIKPERVETALRLADLSAVTVNDAGDADTAAITAALEAVLTDLPELKGAGGAVGGGSNPAGGGTGKIDISKLTDTEFAALQARIQAGERIEL